MTTAEFDALTDLEVCAIIAEKVMNLKVILPGGQWPWPQIEHSLVYSDPENNIYEKKEYYTVGCACYSTDLNACHEMEEKIRIQYGHSYVKSLWEITNAALSSLRVKSEWILIHAAARQKCKAALIAIGEIKDACAASGTQEETK